MYVTVGRDILCIILLNAVMPPIARGQTWFFQPLPVSTVPNTGRNQYDSGYRGFDEEDYGPIPYTLDRSSQDGQLLYDMKHCSCHKLVAILTGTGVRKACELANRARLVVQTRKTEEWMQSHLHPCPFSFIP